MNQNNKSMIALTIIVLLSALLWALGIRIAYSKIKQTNTIQNVKIQDSLRHQQLSNFSSKLLKKNITIDDLITSLPDNANFLQFVDFIENTGAKNDTQLSLDFEGLKQKGAKKIKTESTNKVVFELQIIGSEPDVRKTIEQIENGKYFIEFDKIDFISRSDDSTLGSAKLEGNLYVKNGFKKQ